MADQLKGKIDWQVTTFAGNRRRQHQEFRALTFREKLQAIEAAGEVGAFFASRRPEVYGVGRKKVENGDAGKNQR